MAFDKSNLHLIQNLGGVMYYGYVTTDAPTVIDTTGYFNDAADQLPVGSIVLAIEVDNVLAPSAATSAGHHIVNANDGTTVDVTNATALSTTDSD